MRPASARPGRASHRQPGGHEDRRPRRTSHVRSAVPAACPTATAPRPPALLGETIGANLRRMAAAHRGRRGAGRRAVRPAVDLRAVRRRDRHAGPRPDRGRVAAGRPGRHLGAELRGMGAAPVRDRQGRRDPGQHQPGLPQPRARLRAAPVGRAVLVSAESFKTSDYRAMVDEVRGGPARAASDVIFSARPTGTRWSPRARRRWRAGTGPAGRARGRPVLRRPDQHPVHQRHDRLPEGRDAVAPQHPEQRLLHRRRLPVHPSRTGSASRCRSITASAWCWETWPAPRTAPAS